MGTRLAHRRSSGSAPTQPRRAPRRARTRGGEGERRGGFLPDSVGGEATVADVSERPASSPATNPNASPNDVSSASKRARDPRLPSATSVWEPLQARANHSLSLPGASRTTTSPRFAAPRRCVTSTARRTPKAPRSPGVVCSASWRTRHTRWRAAVRRRGSPSTRATTRASSRCSRCWARLAAVAARRVHGGGRDVDALAGRASGGAAALERAFGDGEGGGRGYGSGGVQRRGASARGVRGTGLDSRRGFMLARRLQGHGAREGPEDYRAACVAAAKL